MKGEEKLCLFSACFGTLCYSGGRKKKDRSCCFSFLLCSWDRFRLREWQYLPSKPTRSMCTVWRCFKNSQIEENEGWNHGEHKKSDERLVRRATFVFLHSKFGAHTTELAKNLKIDFERCLAPSIANDSNHNNDRDSSLWSWATKKHLPADKHPFQRTTFPNRFKRCP